jgi:hypothetical protein
MSTSQVLDRTFSLYRKNFILFAGIAMLPPACLLIGELLFVVLGFSTLAEAKDPAVVATAGVAMVGGFFVLGVLWLAGYAFTSGGSVFAVSRLHLGSVTTIRESFRLIQGSFWRILGVVFLSGLASGAVIVATMIAIFVVIGASSVGGTGPRVVAGIVSLFIGVAGFAVFLIVTAKFSLAIPACVIERCGVSDAIGRSFKLTEGTILRLILVFVLAFVLSIALSLVFSIVPYLIGIAVMAVKKDTSMVVPLLAVKYLGDFVASTLAYPIATIAVSLIYYDQRVRKEAFDLQFMMEAMGQAAPPPPPAAPAPNIG